MPQRIAPFVEVVFGFLTITSTLFFTEVLTDLFVGTVVYFTSRFLYKKYGEKVYKWIERFSKNRF